jgi:hypothetical protein
MPLLLLLDEHIAPTVAEQVHVRRVDIPIESVHDWRNGDFVGQDDEALLIAAFEDGMTLVTYDQKTIPPLLVEFAASGRSHGGIVFVDHRTIPTNDFGGLVVSLIAFWDRTHEWDWTDRIAFLDRADA